MVIPAGVILVEAAPRVASRLEVLTRCAPIRPARARTFKPTGRRIGTGQGPTIGLLEET